MSGRLNFRTVTYVVGPEIDEWLERQAYLGRGADERDLRDAVRWWIAYRLLGGAKSFAELEFREPAA
jgi:hypothetical protein